MLESTAQRQERILERLRAQQRITIAEMAADLGVSAMTVHRDLDKLAAQGLLVKSRGGAALAHHYHTEPSMQHCLLCGGTVQPRTAFVLRRSENGHAPACCAHCGLLLLAHDPDALLALTADFIHGRMVSVRDATYLVGSRVDLCCSPSILTFACPEDAGSFQCGFGGTIMDFVQVLDYLAAQISLGPVS